MFKKNARLQLKTSLQLLKGNGNIKKAWENIKENIEISAQESLGYCELKHHKPCFD
jgi:hypothetical protein